MPKSKFVLGAVFILAYKKVVVFYIFIQYVEIYTNF